MGSTNPIGSTTIPDLFLNAGNLDRALHSEENSWTDRFGIQRITYSYMEKNVTDLINNISGPNGATKVGIGNGRTQADKNAEFLSVRDFITTNIDGITSNQDGIEKAVLIAKQTGKELLWPVGTYVSTKNIPYFKDVVHTGRGVLKRDDTTFTFTGTKINNTIHVSPSGYDINDGITSNYPIRTIQDAFNILENFGNTLFGTWKIQLSSGTFTEQGIITGIRSKNQIQILGSSTVDPVTQEPTTIIDVTGRTEGYAIWIGNEMRFLMSNILLKGARNGTGLASGLVMDAGVTGRLNNVWTRNCEQNGVNANIRCRLVVSGGDYEADATSLRVYGNSTAYIGYNGVRVRCRNSDTGVDVTGSSYSHSDYIDFINTKYGIISEYESHSTNYNNTFDTVRVAWESRDSSTINTSNPTFINEPSVSKARKLFGFLGLNTDLTDQNRDTRNIQFYPYFGTSGRWAIGYNAITAPFKTYQFSADGLPSIIDWSSGAGVNFVLDWASEGANYFGVGAKSNSFSGIAFGDEVSPTRAILRHQAGSIFYRLENVSKYRFTSTAYGPFVDNDVTCGSFSFRNKEIFSVNGVNTTSDKREKSSAFEIPETVLDAIDDVKIILFKWLSAIKEKGEENARKHAGAFAQQIVEAFNKHGEDATEFGLLCYDKWKDVFEDEFITVIQEDGDLKTVPTGKKILVLPAGDRYSLRVDQCHWLLHASQRRTNLRLELKIDEIQTQLKHIEERLNKLE
ncbi:tail fiber domain-containing protein [Aeromonas phage ZPAH34]|uniref:tail spike protein n=1 Tax=Aeromonas phage ZPAH34 TaxID=2924888 RepID=UPI002329085F|nr:tail spike protein [Aeromonas phage ZPAH34]UOX39547.1 tail fiber domain-containing protein [Aeromonas phage ZPAH34]